MESLVQERIQKERKESKIRHGRGENGRKDCRMRTFVYQKERSCHKRRNMMRRLVDQNYRRCQKRERRMERFTNQKVRRLQNTPKTLRFGNWDFGKN